MTSRMCSLLAHEALVTDVDFGVAFDASWDCKKPLWLDDTFIWANSSRSSSS